jgi:hypothetical protein
LKILKKFENFPSKKVDKNQNVKILHGKFNRSIVLAIYLKIKVPKKQQPDTGD